MAMWSLVWTQWSSVAQREEGAQVVILVRRRHSEAVGLCHEENIVDAHMNLFIRMQISNVK